MSQKKIKVANIRGTKSAVFWYIQDNKHRERDAGEREILVIANDGEYKLDKWHLVKNKFYFSSNPIDLYEPLNEDLRRKFLFSDPWTLFAVR